MDVLIEVGVFFGGIVVMYIDEFLVGGGGVVLVW